MSKSTSAVQFIDKIETLVGKLDQLNTNGTGWTSLYEWQDYWDSLDQHVWDLSSILLSNTVEAKNIRTVFSILGDDLLAERFQYKSNPGSYKFYEEQIPYMENSEHETEKKLIINIDRILRLAASERAQEEITTYGQIDEVLSEIGL